jgi:hypothetical protein
MGATDQLFLEHHLIGKKRYICFPEAFTYGQILKIFEKYIDDHPETLHEDLPVLFYNALVTAFPCK